VKKLSQLIVATFFVFVAALFVPGSSAENSGRFVTGFVQPVSAQTASKKKRKSLFRMLFGRKKTKKSVVKRRTTKRARKRSKSKRRVAKRSKTSNRRTTKRKTRKRVRIAGASSLPKEVLNAEKVESAKKVLVIGDFFGGGLADGLDELLKDSATIVVVDKTRALSGFVRNDIVDWPKVVAGMVEEEKPNFIVAMLGSNDRQLMRESGKKLKKRTPEWDAAYTARVTNLAKALGETGVPFTWMGLPPVRFENMNKDYLVFNEIYSKAATTANGRFIDVWDGFSDEERAYSRSGPDVQGQIVLLRRKNGINLTKAGRRRLAFFVEPIIRRTLESDTALAGLPNEFGGFPPTFNLDTFAPKKDVYDPKSTRKTIVVRLGDAAADDSAELAGDRSTDQKTEVPAPSAELTGRVALRSGRADNFAWPPTDAQPAPAATATASN